MNRLDFPFLGFGVGLRRPHYSHILETRPRMDWFEAITENFMVEGGRPLQVLEGVRANYPIVFHGVSMSIGSTDRLNRKYLRELKLLTKRFDPAWVSDHLCWTSVGHHNTHDLLPLPYTEEVVRRVAGRVREVQETLERRILLENVSSYMSFAESTLSEWEFLSAVSDEADCGILLDINNVFVSAFNHGFSAEQYIDSVPTERVVQFHMAGHADHGSYLLDSHDHPVREEVWMLYERAAKRFGPISTLVEWDDNIPEFEVLAGTADTARMRASSALGLSGESEMTPDGEGSYHVCGSGTRAEDGIMSGRLAQGVRSSLVNDGYGFKAHLFLQTLAVPHNLKNIQGLLYRLMTASQGVASRLRIEFPHSSKEIDSIVRGDSRLGAVERLEIYATAYFYRLLDCLKEDFPATLAVLGAENFQRLVADYLAEIPPTEPSIFYAGRYLADFVGRHHLGREWPFAEDLARLERTTIEVFHGPDAVSLDASTMQSIAPEQWPTFTLRAHPAVKFLNVNWKVTDLLRSVNEGRALRAPAQERTRVIVFRQDTVVYFRELELAEQPALEFVRQPVKFSELCDRIAEAIQIAEPANEINRLFQRWLSDGILVADGE